MSRGTIIFDFDGTLADSFDLVSNFLAGQAGKKTLTAAERQQLKGKSMNEIARKLKIPPWRYLWLFFRGRRMMSKKITSVRPFDGIEDAVRELHGKDYQLYVLSSNSNKNIKLFLKQQGLLQYFTKTQGSASFFGKARALRKLLRKNKLNPEDCSYVCDEVRDIYAAHHSGVRSVAVGWGYNDIVTLTSHKPSAVAEAPRDLNKIFSSTMR